MPTRLEALGGTSDLLPVDTACWQQVESTARQVLRRYGYQEIRTPIIENAQVFLQSLGESTEIVQKQMYLFKDRGDRDVALRPEGTASAVRAYLEHGLDKTGGLVKWYYVGPMFRAERPQQGRRRQFHQLGVEVFGSASPYQDIEVIGLLMHLLRELGLTKSGLRLNNLGCRKDRPVYVEQLRQYFGSRHDDLCDECQQRLLSNPLRILDCKQPRCRTMVEGAHAIQWVCDACREHVATVTEWLNRVDVAFDLDPHLVRGLDYYTRTAFEVVHPGLGAQDAVGGGGRYDDLVEQMGGLPVPAVGFAVGLERVLMAMEHEHVALQAVEQPEVFIATLGGNAEQLERLRIAHQLRVAGISVETNYEPRSIKRQFEMASKLGCRYVVVIGPDELQNRTATLKDMARGEQEAVPIDQLDGELRRRLGPVGASR